MYCSVTKQLIIKKFSLKLYKVKITCSWVASNFREFTKPIRAKVTIGHSNLTTTDANM